MPWAPAYASAAELAGHLGVTSDPQMAQATEAASRMIDRACGRTFGLLSSSEFRWYEADYYRGSWTVKIHDLMTTTGLTVETADPAGNPVAEITTDYLLTPRNAAAEGRPWTRLEILASSPVKPDRHGVRVTARWGWTTVPGPIKYATLVQAALLYERRRNVNGPLTSEKVDDVAYTYGAAAELDTDAAGMIAPYRKLWVAA